MQPLEVASQVTPGTESAVSTGPLVGQGERTGWRRRHSIKSALVRMQHRVISALATRLTSWGGDIPTVSFTFDDFPRSAVTAGATLLKTYGARGTYYAAMGLVNTRNGLGEHFTLDDLHLLHEEGHEVGSHTFTHVGCHSLSHSRFALEIEKGRSAIRELAGFRDSGNFAYPFGQITWRVKRTVGPAFTSCRSTFPGLNSPQVDLNLLRGNPLYGDVDRAEQAKQLILRAATTRGWLIFYTHDVRPSPSPFGCTPGLLQTVIEFAMQRGCRILTVREALQKCQPSPVGNLSHGKQ